jgi:hypothetical protein
MNNMRSGNYRPQPNSQTSATRQRQNGAGNAYRNYERYGSRTRSYFERGYH